MRFAGEQTGSDRLGAIWPAALNFTQDFHAFQHARCGTTKVDRIPSFPQRWRSLQCRDMKTIPIPAPEDGGWKPQTQAGPSTHSHGGVILHPRRGAVR